MSRAPAYLLACLLVTGTAAPAQEAGPTLLMPGATSYAASGGYALSLNDGGGRLSVDLFAPARVGDGRAAFTQAKLRYGTDNRREWGSLSLGRAMRFALDDRRVIGFNAYLDTVKRAAHDRFMGQIGVGAEYEISGAGSDPASLRFGSNVYLPFRDYTAARLKLSGGVPRQGMDSFVSVSRGFGKGLRLGTRLSIFHYPETGTRDERGIATLALEGTLSNGLPKGTTLTARLTGRYSPGAEIEPRLRVELRRVLRKPKAAGKRPVGALQPSRNCSIHGAASALDRLDCGSDRTYTARKKHEMIQEGETAGGSHTVPPPQRQLGYGTVYVP